MGGKGVNTTVAFVFTLLTALVLQNGRTEGARILCIGHQFGSHLLMLHTAAEGLIQNGHEVYTVYSDKMTVPKDLEAKGFKILKYHTPEDSFIMATGESAAALLDDIFNHRPQDISTQSGQAGAECVDMDEDLSLDTQIRALKFDLFIIDVFPLSTCLTFMALKYNVPFVLIPPGVDLESTRTFALPSFVPMALLLSSDNMSFMERLKNTALTAVMSIPAIGPFTAVKDTTLLKKYNKDPEVTEWVHVNRKAELFMVSRGPILEYPIPLMPNVINIECLTCYPARELDTSIKSMVDDYDGVIVVSFGSLIAEFPDHVADKFLEAFAQRRELIVWRYKGNFKSKVPDNVKVMKWLPQNDLLGNNKTKLFITHSGNNGQYESVYHGVPMLAFPLFAEQPHNADRIVRHGYGLQSDITSFTVETLLKQIAEIIDTPSYREATQKASQILKTTPMNPRETTAFWIDHILEFGGEHLRSHALKMPWYSAYMFDILLFLEAVLVVIVCVFLCFCSFLYRHLTGSNRTKVKTH